MSETNESLAKQQAKTKPTPEDIIALNLTGDETQNARYSNHTSQIQGAYSRIYRRSGNAWMAYKKYYRQSNY